MTALAHCHATTAEICQQAADLCRGTRTEILLRAIAKQQSSLAQVAAAWPATADASVLNAWVQFVPLEEIEKDINALQTNSLPPETIAEIVLDLQNDTAESIAEMQRGSSVAEFSDALKQLSELEAFEARQTAEAIVKQHDL